MKRLAIIGTLIAAFAFAMNPVAAHAGGINIMAQIAPPQLLNYDQPYLPGDGYIWEPGYWAWSPGGYYWVPGEWVLPPQYGSVWTPGYWAFADRGYSWMPGYWGNQIGYYGGINYGNGYYGNGYAGGRWYGHRYHYNRAVTHVRWTNRNVYFDRSVVVHRTVRTSYNGGNGIHARPTEAQQNYARQRHVPPTAMQRNHVAAAARNPIRPNMPSHVMQRHAAPPVVHQQSAPRVVHHQPAPHVQQQPRPQYESHRTRPERAPQQPQHNRAPAPTHSHGPSH